MPAFQTSDFGIFDPVDLTKILTLDVSGIPSNTISRLGVPSGFTGFDTWIVAGFDNTFSGNTNTFTAGSIISGINGNAYFEWSAGPHFTLQDQSDTTKQLQFDPSGISTGTTRTVTLQNSSGTMALLEATQTFTGDIEFDGNLSFVGGVEDFSGATVNLPATSTSLGSHNIDDPGTNGAVVVYGDSTDPPGSAHMGRVDRTNQSADISSVKLTDSTPAGMYQVLCYLECTTQDAAAGTVTVTFTYTDDVGSTTFALSQALTATGRSTLTPAGRYLASGNIAWAVTHSGSYGTAKYALRIRCEYLG